MENNNYNNAPYVYWGKSAYVRTLKLEKIHENLIKKVGENDVFFGDAQSLFYDFLEALRNVKLSQWREMLLNKKYILIDGFHYFEEKKSTLEELTYIFKHTKAVIILTLNKPIAHCNFGDEITDILNMGTEKEIEDEYYEYIRYRSAHEHWKIGYSNTLPTAKAAWLIKQDKSLTLEEKHKAWMEIIATMPDYAVISEDYPDANIDSIHCFLSAYMDLEKRLLEQFYKKESNAVYTYKVWCDEDQGWIGSDGPLYVDFEDTLAEFKDDADLIPRLALFTKVYFGAEHQRLYVYMRPDGSVMRVAEDLLTLEEYEYKLFYAVFYGMELAFKNKTEDEK